MLFTFSPKESFISHCLMTTKVKTHQPHTTEIWLPLESISSRWAELHHSLLELSFSQPLSPHRPFRRPQQGVNAPDGRMNASCCCFTTDHREQNNKQARFKNIAYDAKHQLSPKKSMKHNSSDLIKQLNKFEWEAQLHVNWFVRQHKPTNNLKMTWSNILNTEFCCHFLT